MNEKFGDQPVNLVAHSMGGLVSRNFIRRHQKHWDAMRGDDQQGGRLVMLGTPNFGSFNIPQVFTGVESLVVLLSRADLGHDLARHPRGHQYLSRLLSHAAGSLKDSSVSRGSTIATPGVTALFRATTWSEHGSFTRGSRIRRRWIRRG